MQVTREKINGLFAQLDMPMAEKWSVKRLGDKIQKLPSVVDEDTDAGEYQELLDDILEAVENGTEIDITDGDDEDEAPAKKSTKKKGAKKAPAAKSKSKGKKAKPADDEDEEEEAPPKKSKSKKSSTKSKKAAKAEADDDEDDDDDEPVKPKKGKVKKKADSKPKAKKGPGVIATIIELLQAATKKKPITKDAIRDELVERFPERDGESMMRTINVQVPNRIKSDKGLTVVKTDKGYYIED